ncbi:MAG: L-aspartate oxidase [Planctomycetota bacterium]|nr:MAG: L-aspartate oxidase [Planctomycetota bacterium]REJ96849.1 MAG: L-aspartate oxidase [Planctomycetota bacterium]REK24038.1 MAG: L-aspartate oxidase [Planctomycetota bacterium]REK39369.1 MAG: L-aspartate oxidase [Planctomycetota bacterium]
MHLATPRYLVPFHPKRLPHRFVDVLIVGGGLAGLRAAIEIDPALDVLVVTKDDLHQSSSAYAQGGIAGVLDPSDRFEDHIADTLEAGRNLCNRDIVEMVVRDGPQRIRELIEWGARFDQTGDQLDLGREGGHSRHRVVHANGDATGREIMRTVINWTDKLPHVELWENAFTIDLLTHREKCRGGLVWQSGRGMTLVWAKQTILCTGGVGQIYRETSNPEVATGDGHAIAYRAGAELADMEFMQFHPTMLYIAGSSRTLITEAVRGEAAYLVDNTGRRFMGDFDERMELAPRDVVSQAITTQMEKTRHPCVYLDLTHLDGEHIKSRFPGIDKTCAKFGLDVARDPIPVRPGAHYFIGGVTVDAEGRTSLENLWAAGEVTASGLHGANRLASNSLLEGMVFGAHAGAGASQAAAAMSDELKILPVENETIERASLTDDGGEPLNLDDIRNSLKSLMWRNVGVERVRERLEEAADNLDLWCRYVLPRQFDDIPGWELQNMLLVARLMVAGALAREETRGVHQRTDFPDTDDGAWRRHLAFRRGEPV